MRHSLSCAFAATLFVASPAFAVTAMDARSLGMGNAATAVANDANAPAWNPAGLSQGNGFFYLPTQFGLRFGNNAIGLSELSSINDTITAVSNYQKSPSTQTFPTIPSFVKNGDFRLGADADLGIFGLSLPVPTPFRSQGKANVGLSLWGRVNGDSRFVASDFFNAVDSVYAGLGDTDKKIAARVNNVKTILESNTGVTNVGVIKDQVNGIITDLDAGMGPLLDSKDKQAEVSIKAGSYLTTVLTASHQIKPPSLPLFPNAKFSIGTNLKVFSSLDPFAMSGNAPTLPIGDQKETMGLPETLRFQAKGNLGSAYADLKAQVADFAANPTADKFSDFSNASQKLTQNIPIDVDITSTKAAATGFGCDLGALAQLDDRLTVGAALINPLLIWPATQTVRHTTWDGAKKAFVASPASSKSVTYRDSEPVALRLGGSYKTILNLRLAADLEQEFSDIPPALRLGGEWGVPILPLSLRAGGQLGGEANSLNLGLGLNAWALKMNLGAGVEPSFKAAAAAFSGSLSF